MRNKKTLSIVILIIMVVVAILIAVFWPKTTSGQGIILYVSNTCPHCKTVEDFIQANDISSKVQFQTKEVSANLGNAQELLNKATKCGISTDQVGVPLLWDGSKCLLGEPDITAFFKTKAGIN